MPAVPPGIAAYVRRRGPLAGRGASARFRSLPWAARLGLSPGRPADIGRCQRGGDDENELAHGRFRQSDMRGGRTMARTSTGRRDDKLEEDLEFSCRISGDWGKGGLSFRRRRPRRLAGRLMFPLHAAAATSGLSERCHIACFDSGCIEAVVARYRPGIGCVLAIQSRQAR